MRTYSTVLGALVAGLACSSHSVVADESSDGYLVETEQCNAHSYTHTLAWLVDVCACVYVCVVWYGVML